MDLKSLFRKRTGVSLIVCSLVVTSFGLIYGEQALAQASPAAAPAYYPPQKSPQTEYVEQCFDGSGNKIDSPKCKTLEQYLPPTQAGRNSERSEEQCRTLIKEIKTEQSKFSSACGGSSCVNKIKACQDSDTAAGNAMYMAGGMGGGDACMSMMANASCPEKNAGKAKEYEDEKKSLEDKKKDIQDKLNDLNKEGVDLQKKARDSQRELQSKFKQNDMEKSENEQKTLQGIEQAIAQIGKALTKAMQDSRAEMLKLDQQYIKMRDDARKAADAVTEAKIAMVNTCRAQAESEYQKANQELKKQLEDEDKIVKNFVSAGRMAGQQPRIAKRAERQRSLNFAAFYKDCMGGSGQGKEANANITRLENERKRVEANLVDVSIALEKQRAEVMRLLAEAQQELTAERARLVKEAEQAMKSIEATHAANTQELQQEAAAVQQDLMSEQQYLQQRLSTEGQEMYKTDMEIQMNHGRLQCARMTGGSLKESSSDRRLDKYGEAAAALSNLVSSCQEMEYVCAKPLGATWYSDRESMTEAKESRSTASRASQPGGTAAARTTTQASAPVSAESKRDFDAVNRACLNYADKAGSAGIIDRDIDDDVAD